MNAAAPYAPTPCAPSWTLLTFEPLRAAVEYACMRLMDCSAMPAGDGHPVVLFPGLASEIHATNPLRSFCRRLGYTTYDWGRGLNTGPRGDVSQWLDALAHDIRKLASAHHERISLVGWSLGGIYAREVAKRLDRRVRHVITIGSPFAGSPEQTNAGLIYRLLNGRRPALDEALSVQFKTPPRVPTTSIYSRSDGVVAWQTCIQAGGAPHTENIEVSSSHCGLGWNPAVYSIIADRLRQPEGAWRPYANA